MATKNVQCDPSQQRDQSLDQHFTLAGAHIALLEKEHCPQVPQCWREEEMTRTEAARDPGR